MRALGKERVLDMNAGDASPDKFAHGSHGVQRFAEASAAVDDDRHSQLACDVLGQADLLGYGQLESLLAGDLDALITLYNHDVMAGTAGRDIRFEKISEEGYSVIAPCGHRMTRARSVSWKMLAEAPWVLTRKPSLARVFLEDSFRRHGLTPPVPICETDGPITAARMVAAGGGLSSVPETTAKDALKSQAVGLVKLQTPQPTATLGLVYRTASADHPRIALLRQALPVGE